MDFLKNACKCVSGAVKGIGTKIATFAAAALVSVGAVSAEAAEGDYSALGTAVTTNLSGLSTVLMTIAGTIIGVVVVVVAFRFVKRMLG